MTEDERFWWNFVVQAVAAVATIMAVVVAVYGGWIRTKLGLPKLNLTLENEKGLKAPCFLPDDGAHVETVARWYHVHVENSRQPFTAHGVQVFLIQIEEPDPVGAFKITWRGRVPIRWQHLEANPPIPRDLGMSISCDLCCIIKEKWLALPSVIMSVPEEFWRKQGACHLLVTLQACSIETDSDVLRVELAWDGQWADDTEEMSRHMVVKSAS